MTISLGDVETTALIPVAIKASETLRKLLNGGNNVIH